MYWDCPRCSAENSLDAKCCWRCGYQYFAGPQPVLPAAEPPRRQPGVGQGSTRALLEEMKKDIQVSVESSVASLDRLAGGPGGRQVPASTQVEQAAASPAGNHPLLPVFLQMARAARASMGTGWTGQRAAPGDVFGVWKATVETPNGVLRTETVLQPNDEFSQMSTLGGMMAYDVGTIQRGDGWIHFVVRDHEPKDYHGVRVKWIESWTWFYAFVDANTMTFEDRVAHSKWTVRRG